MLSFGSHEGPGLLNDIITSGDGYSSARTQCVARAVKEEKDGVLRSCEHPERDIRTAVRGARDKAPERGR